MASETVLFQNLSDEVAGDDQKAPYDGREAPNDATRDITQLIHDVFCEILICYSNRKNI